MAERKKKTLLSHILGYYVLVLPRVALEEFLYLCMRYGFNYYGIRIDNEQKKVFIDVPSYQFKRIMTACSVWQIRVKSEGIR